MVTNLITYRISYMLRARSGEPIHRETVTTPDTMGDAVSSWQLDHPDALVVACTIADHPLMHGPVDA